MQSRQRISALSRARNDMLAFLLFAIFCLIVWALFRAGHWGIAAFLIIAFLAWGFFSLG